MCRQGQSFIGVRAAFAKRVRCLIFLPAFVVAGVPLSGQQPATPVPKPAPAFYWGVDVGVTALSALIQGRAFRVAVYRSLVAGAIGGSVIYAGQRVVGSTEPSLRLIGVETVALGANLGRNIGRGVPAFSDLSFPLFPLIVRVRPRGKPAVSARISAMGVMGAVRMVSTYGRAPDLLQSLVSGALVFPIPHSEVHCYEEENSGCLAGRVGEHFAGAIAFAEYPEPCTARLVVAHEMGHVAQDVRDIVLNAVPMSDLALERSGGIGRWISRYLVLDAFLPLMAASRIGGPPSFDPSCRDAVSFYECETEAMLWRRTCTGP